MPSDEKSQYAPEPPIPSYDEATRGASSSRPDWQPPPASPRDTRPDHETEAQSLLTTSQPRQQGGRQAAGGYRAPYVESDDDGSEWTLDSDDDDELESLSDSDASSTASEPEPETTTTTTTLMDVVCERMEIL